MAHAGGVPRLGLGRVAHDPRSRPPGLGALPLGRREASAACAEDLPCAPAPLHGSPPCLAHGAPTAGPGGARHGLGGGPPGPRPGVAHGTSRPGAGAGWPHPVRLWPRPLDARPFGWVRLVRRLGWLCAGNASPEVLDTHRPTHLFAPILRCRCTFLPQQRRPFTFRSERTRRGAKLPVIRVRACHVMSMH